MPLQNFRQDFFYFTKHNLFFFAVQIIYYWLISNNFTRAISLPIDIYLIIFGEVTIQILLYVIVASIQASWLWALAQQLPIQKIKYNTIRRLLFWITILFLMTLNHHFFPLSRFNHMLAFLQNSVLEGIWWTSLFIVISLSVNTCIQMPYRQYMLGFTVLGCVSYFISIQASHPHIKPLATKLPHIILIGIDSLNLAYVTPQTTPTIYRLATQGVHFTNTISPLARTYPAWTSILTGLYPYHHHARENLMPAQLVKSEASIVWQLRFLGYQTFFASDDRRFNNLDKDFGFQTIVGPPLGVNDILLGGFYDFPLTNILLNFKISQWLFPYNYMNRASQYSYFPATFDNTLQQAIETNITQSPALIAVHFTLPHWPYAWAVSSAQDASDLFHLHQKRKLYAEALKTADKQVAKLYATLEQQGLLANSMIIVLSDHGEAFYEKGSRITRQKNYQEQGSSIFSEYLKKKTSTSLERSSGHGSDLLSPEQFQCLLSIQIRKNNSVISHAHSISTRVALIDIAPTIFAWLNNPSFNKTRHFDGISLLASLYNPAAPLPQRDFILESGTLPNQFLSPQKAIYYAQRMYHVNPENNHLEIIPNSLPDINNMKLYGILHDNWLLALYPYQKNYLPVIIELQTKTWTDNPLSVYGKKTPFKKMHAVLEAFYHRPFATKHTSKIEKDTTHS